MNQLRWILSAALAAYACLLAVHHATPIDRALPLLAIAVTVCAALSYPSVMLGVPLLIAAEIVVFDEHLRLLAFGVVVATAVAIAMVFPLANRRPSSGLRPPSPRMRGEGQREWDAPKRWSDAVGDLFRAGRREGQRESSAASGALAVDTTSSTVAPLPAWRGEGGRRPGEGRGRIAVALIAIILLRWIPLERVQPGRELFLLAVCAAIVFVLGRTPFAVAIAVVTALATPAIPLRTLALPLIVLGVAIAARLFGMPRLRLTWPSTMVVAFALLFFAWSGVVARAFPFFLRKAAEARLQPVAIALRPGEPLILDVPPHAKSLILSGGNIAHLRRGARLAWIDPGARLVRIGEAADWGALRLDVAYGARNPLPRNPAGKLRDYGYDAWVDGAGRVALPAGARSIRVIADPSLPANATLQVEGFE